MGGDKDTSPVSGVKRWLSLDSEDPAHVEAALACHGKQRQIDSVVEKSPHKDRRTGMSVCVSFYWSL